MTFFFLCFLWFFSYKFIRKLGSINKCKKINWNFDGIHEVNSGIFKIYFFPSRNMECFSTSKLFHLFLYFSSYVINTALANLDAFPYMFCPLSFHLSFKNKLASILSHYNFTNKFYIMHMQGFQYFNFTMTESQLFFKHKKVGLISSLGNCQMTKHSLDTDSKIQFPA